MISIQTKINETGCDFIWVIDVSEDYLITINYTQ